MFSIQQPLLVFRDCQWHLLDGHAYDWQPAAPWLSRLREANVTVILCSSKTWQKCCTCKKRWGYKGYR